MRRLLLAPVAASTGNGTAAVSALSSALTSCGAGTVSPYFAATGLQVLLSGKNLYQSPLNYRWQQYAFECGFDKAINGGASPGLMSSSLSEQDFCTRYGYVSINLARHMAADDVQQKSLQLTFTNSSLRTVDILAYIFYERSFQIDVNSGRIVV
jgi:hypothetical protein